MTKYTLTKPLPNEFKIQVNPEQSEALQLELFKMGKRWTDGTQKIILTDQPYLCVYDDDDFAFELFEKRFKTDPKEEIQFSDYFTENKEEMTPQQLIKEAKEQIAKANELIKEAEQVINRPKEDGCIAKEKYTFYQKTCTDQNVSLIINYQIEKGAEFVDIISKSGKGTESNIVMLFKTKK